MSNFTNYRINLFFKKIISFSVIVFFLSVCFVNFAQAATYNLTSGQYPPCGTTNIPAWSVSGTTYTCNGDGRVTLASGDVLTASTAINIVAANGFSLTSNTIGSASANINLTSSYGTVVSAGTNTLYGYIQTDSGAITLTGVTVSGAITSSGSVNLTGGSVGGLVTSSSNTITTNGTSLFGGATTSLSSMSITGGTIAGAFRLNSNNPATFSGVTMTSGSISGASTVSITGSTLGSSSNSITITSTSGAVSLSSSTVYGTLTAPSYSTINVPSGSAVYGTCSPGSTPANACTLPTTCTTGFIGGITGSYFNNKTLTGTAAGTRLDTSINFDWGTGAPGVSGIGVDNFSVRWSGSIRAPVTGSYTFQTISDDGVRLWVNGQQIINNWTDHSVTTNNSSSVVLTSGQSYTIVMEFYENGGSAVAKLNWLIPGYGTYSAISTQAASNPNTGASCTISGQCAGGGLLGGASGKYYNNTNLTGTAAATRIDTAIDFNWDTGSPGVTGVGTDNFSVRWDGYIKVPTTGNYQFETVSDDGVRLWINGQQVIDNWTSHSQTSDTTGNIALTAGTSYAVRVEYFEAGGVSTIALHWKTPSDTNFVSIPTCPSAVAYYGISHSGTGITCAGEPITFTAYDNLGAPVAPTVGSQITLSTVPSTGVWAGGNTYSFTGGETNIIKYLQQTTAATLNINVTDGTYSETGSLDPSINFVDSALKVYGSLATLNAIQTQVAGVTSGDISHGSVANNNPILKAIRTDNSTGACVAQITGSRTVNFAYECVNPTTCTVTGQVFNVNGYAIKANNKGATIAYQSQTLTFDSTGTTNIPLNFTDVGQVTLYAQTTLPATTNDPQKVLSGVSNSFVVKPYTLIVSSVLTASGGFNPGGTTVSGTANGFVAAGSPFQIQVEARKYPATASTDITPNFGKETTSEAVIKLKVVSLVYPTGSGTTTTPITGNTSYSATIPTGTWLNTGVIWDQVGSITIQAEYGDTLPVAAPIPDYLGAGDLIVKTPSVTIGRFYPDHYTLIPGSLVTNSCTTSPSLIFMGQPAASWTYTLEAQGFTGTVLKNYGIYGSPAAKPYGVAENANNGTNIMSRLSAAKSAVDTGVWSQGVWSPFASGATFDRLAAGPDGPYSSLQLGLGVTDTFDSRSLSVKNMNATTTTTCSGATCAEIALGSPWDVRFGRLRLDDAFGPETAPLPVNFISEYWTGNHFSLNPADSCTLVARTAVSYKWGVNYASGGALSNSANISVPLSTGTTQGTYFNMDTATTGDIHFSAGNAGQQFTAPSSGGMGAFIVVVDMTNLPWLRFDWNQDGDYSDTKLPNANFSFGSYRGNDRVIYWRERLQ